jgi:hypothetical protein
VKFDALALQARHALEIIRAGTEKFKFIQRLPFALIKSLPPVLWSTVASFIRIPDSFVWPHHRAAPHSPDRKANADEFLRAAVGIKPNGHSAHDQLSADVRCGRHQADINEIFIVHDAAADAVFLHKRCGVVPFLEIAIDFNAAIRPSTCDPERCSASCGQECEKQNQER